MAVESWLFFSLDDGGALIIFRAPIIWSPLREGGIKT
jgi:hypothetical protein